MPTPKVTAEMCEAEETLDPKNWEEFRGLAHRMVDDRIDYLAGRREEPVWQAMPERVRESGKVLLKKMFKSVQFHLHRYNSFHDGLPHTAYAVHGGLGR